MRPAAGKITKRTGSLVGNRSPLVLFIACFVLGVFAPAFGLGGQALARIAPYDFNELNGISCNYTKQSGSGYPKVSSNPSDGNAKVTLSTYAPNPDGFYIQTLSAEAEGQAGVGIKYIAPMTGRIKIDADVVITGEDKLVESTLLWLPEGVTLIQSPWVQIIAEIVQVLDMALDASISALVQSGVEIRAHRINATPNDANNTIFASRTKPFLHPDLPHAPPIESDQKFYVSELVKDINTGTPPTLILDVTEGEALSICVGIKSQVLATSIFPAIASASANYDAKVQEIRINYLSEQSTPSPPPTSTPAPVQSCGGTWSVGQRVPLKKGAEIRQGSGADYVIHTIVPEDNWPVDVIGGPRCIDGYDWWDISRTAIDGGGTGWINRSQAAYMSGTSNGPLSYSGPEPPSYAPSFAGQTVSWNGNSFRSDDGKAWIFQGSDAERAAAGAAVEARELAEAEARAQDAGVYLQKSNLLELFMDINKNASDYGLRDAEYVIIRGPYKATVYSDYRGEGSVVGIYTGGGTYKLPTTVIGSVKAEIILPPVSEPIPNIPVPMPVPIPLPSGYSGQYFDNQTLSGTPKLTRQDTVINFDWGGGSPDALIPIDHFSARWTKTETFATGDYQFSMTGDDGIRLYIDNVLAIDKWIDQGATTYTVTKTLSAGDHVITMEYYENGGGAVAKLSYQEAIIPQGAAWKYLDNNTRPAGWETTAFDDSTWKSGLSELGYGDGDEATVVGYGPDAGNKYITTYFRKSFTVTNASGYSNLNLRIKRDDGAVVYMNGTEVFRTNMPAGAISHTTLAASAIEDSNFYSTSVSASLLKEGSNVVTVEVHQAGGSSSDMNFDLSFTADVQAVSSTPGVFQQDAGLDGIVSIETEHYSTNFSQGGHSWTQTQPTGASGGNAMEATPNTTTNVNTGYAANSPRLDFTVNFVKTGTHYIWARGIGASGDDDSYHAGLDGVEIASSDRISSFGTSWTWSKSTMDTSVASFNVPASGIHTMNVWMREDGMVLDELVITTNSGYVPSEAGPPESPQGEVEVVPTPTQSVIVSGGTYRLVNQCGEKVLDVSGVSTADGGNVITWTWNGGGNQKWKIDETTAGYSKLTAQHSGKVLDVAGASVSDGANVHQWAWASGANQEWSIVDVGNGYYKLVARHSGKALDVSGGSPSEGANVQQWVDNGSCAQRWKIEKQ